MQTANNLLLHMTCHSTYAQGIIYNRRSASHPGRYSTSIVQSDSCCCKQSALGESVLLTVMTTVACSPMLILGKRACTCLTSLSIIHVQATVDWLKMDTLFFIINWQWHCQRWVAVGFGLWRDLLDWILTVIMLQSLYYTLSSLQALRSVHFLHSTFAICKAIPCICASETVVGSVARTQPGLTWPKIDMTVKPLAIIFVLASYSCMCVATWECLDACVAAESFVPHGCSHKADLAPKCLAKYGICRARWGSVPLCALCLLRQTWTIACGPALADAAVFAALRVAEPPQHCNKFTVIWSFCNWRYRHNHVYEHWTWHSSPPAVPKNNIADSIVVHMNAIKHNL